MTSDFYIEEHLSDGKTRVTAAHRHYKHPETGLWHRSVTGITSKYPKDRLIAWAVDKYATNKERLEDLDLAGRRGAMIHKILDRGGKARFTPEEDEMYRDIWHCVDAAYNWFDTFQPIVHRREFIVYGQTRVWYAKEAQWVDFRYAGTVDLDVSIDYGLLQEHLKNRRKKIQQSWRTGEMVRYWVDYKSGKNLWRSQELQLSGYDSCAEAPKPQGTLLVHLANKSKAGWYCLETNPKADLPVFMHCAGICKDEEPDDDPPSYTVISEYDFTKWLPEKEL